MHLARRNHPHRTKKPDRDTSEQKKSSLRKKRASQGCIRSVEIIPAEQKSRIGMHPAGGNHLYRTNKHAGDASEQKKSSLQNKGHITETSRLCVNFHT